MLVWIQAIAMLVWIQSSAMLVRIQAIAMLGEQISIDHKFDAMLKSQTRHLLIKPPALISKSCLLLSHSLWQKMSSIIPKNLKPFSYITYLLFSVE